MTYSRTIIKLLQQVHASPAAEFEIRNLFLSSRCDDYHCGVDIKQHGYEQKPLLHVYSLEHSMLPHTQSSSIQ